MALSKVADGQAAAATITLASVGIATGDLVVVFAYRNASTTQPTLPAGWTSIANTAGANTNSRTIGYRVITGADNLATIVGTWSNATAICYIALRGQHATTPIGNAGTGGTNTTTLTTPAVSLAVATGSSWVVAFAGSKATNANTVTLSSTTDETSSQGAINLATGRNVASYASRNYSAVVGTAGNRMDAVEVRSTVTHEAAATVTANGTITAAGATEYQPLAATISAAATVTAGAEVFTPGVTHEAAAAISAAATLAGLGQRVAGVAGAISAIATVSPAPMAALGAACAIITAADVSGDATAYRPAASVIAAQAQATAGVVSKLGAAAGLDVTAATAAAVAAYLGAAASVTTQAAHAANASILGVVVHDAAAAVTGSAAAAAVMNAAWAVQAAVEGTATAVLHVIGALIPLTSEAGLVVRAGALASVVPRPPAAEIASRPSARAAIAGPAPAGDVLSTSPAAAAIAVRSGPTVEVAR